MSIWNLPIPIGNLVLGNILLIICSLFYLAWWAVAFRPHASSGLLKSAVLLGVAAAAGIIGLVFAIQGITAAEGKRILLPEAGILAGGIIAYILLFTITYFFLKRQVTTELFLIIGWAVLELSVINTLYKTEYFSFGGAVAFCIITAAAVLISLLCYISYYKLEKTAGFIDGMIPLILAAAVMAAITIKAVA